MEKVVENERPMWHESELMSPSEAAAYLQTYRESVYRSMMRGTLRYVETAPHQRRIALSELRRFRQRFPRKKEAKT